MNNDKPVTWVNGKPMQPKDENSCSLDFNGGDPLYRDELLPDSHFCLNIGLGTEPDQVLLEFNVPADDEIVTRWTKIFKDDKNILSLSRQVDMDTLITTLGQLRDKLKLMKINSINLEKK